MSGRGRLANVARRHFRAAALVAAAACLALLFAATPARSSLDDLDPTFSGDGVATTHIGIDGAYGYAGVLQPDGKIVVTGTAVSAEESSFDFGVARYNANGSLDTSFAGGRVVTPVGSATDYALDIVRQSDGKIVVGGYIEIGPSDADFALVRYTSSGAPDTGYSDDGIVTTPIGAAGAPDSAYAIAIQSDDKVVAVGDSAGDTALARYNTDGSLDSSFSGDGKVVTPLDDDEDTASDVAIQPDGKIVISAIARATDSSPFSFAVARFNTDGTPDNSFSGDGKASKDIAAGDDYATSIAIQPDGKLLVGGFTSPGQFAIVRYLSDGTLDSGFSGDGVLAGEFGPGLNYLLDIELQPDGRIVAAGEHHGPPTGFGVARFQPDGGIDPTFSATGQSVTQIDEFSGAYDAIIQPDGKIIAVGYASTSEDTVFAVARYVPVRHFVDVGTRHWAFQQIETLAEAGITAGCAHTAPRFCPDASVTRGQMAVFLVRAMGETVSSYKGYFSDVPQTQYYARHVERLYELGVTAGCGSGRYCPGAAVTREQMAVFLLRAIDHATHLPAYRGIFSDVPPSNRYARFIEHIYDHGVTSGCATNPRRYCPTSMVTRAQMAVFLVKAFGL